MHECGMCHVTSDSDRCLTFILFYYIYQKFNELVYVIYFSFSFKRFSNVNIAFLSISSIYIPNRRQIVPAQFSVSLFLFKIKQKVNVKCRVS